MHEQVRDFLRRMAGRWPGAVAGASVVEFGAYNVNGSARDTLGCGGGLVSPLAASWVPPDAAAPAAIGAAVPPPRAWLGVDWRPGPGVDVVCLAHEFGRTEDGGRRTEDGGPGFDLAVSTEMLEHDPFWRESLRRMIEMIRPGGCVLVTCAGPGRPAHEVCCAPAGAPSRAAGGHYQGLGLSQVVGWAQECASWDVVYGEAHGAPCDTYVALIGRRTTDDGRRTTDDGRTTTDDRRTTTKGERRPVLSVVVPCVGNVALTRRCLASLCETTANRWELILVENGSTPENREALADAAVDDGRRTNDDGRPKLNGPERVVFLSWDQMLGYPAAVNRGIQAASGEFVCLLNNDTELVTPGWDGVLIEALAVEGAAIAAPVCDFVANPAQHCQTAAPGRVEVETLCFVAVLMRRGLFAQVGLLDEAFGLGNWEDREFCVRTQRAGGRLVVDDGAFVRHVGHGTFRRMRPGVFERLLAVNERLFRAKVRAANAEGNDDA